MTGAGLIGRLLFVSFCFRCAFVLCWSESLELLIQYSQALSEVYSVAVFFSLNQVVSQFSAKHEKHKP